MPYPIQEFWKLALESQLFSPQECQRLGKAFAQIKGAMETGNAFTLSEWLISQRVLTRYQAKVLLARHAGPFIYGDYKVQDRIDSGRLTGLFRAIHVPTRQPVCLAFLSGPQLQDPQALAKLKQTLAAAAAVQHPHVVRLYHVVDLEAYKFAVLADLVGRSLDEFLEIRGPFPPAEACRLARQAALGLAELHKQGQVHGEVRPANLWLDAGNNLRVVYLPLSRDPFASPTTAAAGATDPTLQAAADYLSPEQAAPSRWPVTPLSDLYSLGCTLYHLLTGQPPFAGGDVTTKLRRHAQSEPPLASQINPQVPQPIAQIVNYLLAKDPGGRYQQAIHVAEALAPYIDAAAREPIAEPANSASKAYEQWLTKQRPAEARPAAPAAPMPPTAAPVQPAPMAMPVHAAQSSYPAAVAAVPVAQPVLGGFPQVAMAAPVAAPVMAAPVMAAPVMAAPVAQPAFATQPAPAVASMPLVTERSNLAVQRKQRQRAEGRGKLIIGAVVGVLVMVGGFVIYSSTKKPNVEVVKPEVPTPGSNNAATTTNVANNTPGVKPPEPEKVTPPTPPPSGPPEEPLTSIDGQPLWESPTSGEPLDLRYLPSTSQMFLALRPAEILANAEGRQVLKCLGIEELVQQQLTRLSGTTPDNLEQVVLSFSPSGMGKMPTMSLVARAIKSVEEEALKENWNASESLQVDGKTFYKGEGYSFYAPAEGQSKLLVAVPTTEEKELSAWLAGVKNPPVLERHLELLARSTDNRRHATLLASPKFLFNDGRLAMVGTLGGLVDPAQSFLMDEAGDLLGAALFSLHLSDSLFLEVRSYGNSDATAAARLYRTRLQRMKDGVERYVGSMEVSQYSRMILRRYPDFFDFVNEQTRAGTNDKQVVLRAALPPVAASNLAFGTQLALLEAGGGGYAAPTVSQVPQGPLTVADRLKQKYTLSFDRDSLERTIDLMGKDTGIPMQIEGGALQLEGITKNQSFGLDEKDKPIFEILKTIMKKSNPDGKLIYVYRKVNDQDGIWITTRAAAAKRGDAIPPELK